MTYIGLILIALGAWRRSLIVRRVGYLVTLGGFSLMAGADIVRNRDAGAAAEGILAGLALLAVVARYVHRRNRRKTARQ